MVLRVCVVFIYMGHKFWVLVIYSVKLISDIIMTLNLG